MVSKKFKIEANQATCLQHQLAVDYPNRDVYTRTILTNGGVMEMYYTELQALAILITQIYAMEPCWVAKGPSDREDR